MGSLCRETVVYETIAHLLGLPGAHPPCLLDLPSMELKVGCRPPVCMRRPPVCPPGRALLPTPRLFMRGRLLPWSTSQPLHTTRRTLPLAKAADGADPGPVTAGVHGQGAEIGRPPQGGDVHLSTARWFMLLVSDICRCRSGMCAENGEAPSRRRELARTFGSHWALHSSCVGGPGGLGESCRLGLGFSLALLFLRLH